jgi:hypothetical protein
MEKEKMMVKKMLMRMNIKDKIKKKNIMKVKK